MLDLRLRQRQVTSQVAREVTGEVTCAATDEGAADRRLGRVGQKRGVHEAVGGVDIGLRHGTPVERKDMRIRQD